MRALLLAAALSFPGLAHAGERVRWVLAAGTNDGGEGRERLRHAVDDAAAFASVMTEVGGVLPARVIVLREPGAASLVEAIERLDAYLGVARARGEEPEVFFYYSGHADERGLLPSGELVPWGDLRRGLGGLDAVVRVAVVDACASGALVRDKGGSIAPGFLEDRANETVGEVLLASSSEDEASQESDRIGGAWFTHHLLTGMRGAADVDLNRRVSLDEAYAYANQETVRNTERSWAGAQHPTFRINLVGRGDLVLTDLASRTESIAFDTALDGFVTVRDEQGRLVAELMKTVGLPLRYTLPAGRYSVLLRARGGQYRAEVQVGPGTAVALSSVTFAREGAVQDGRIRGTPEVTWRGTNPLGFHLAPKLGTYGFREDLRLVGLSLDVLGVIHPELRGVELGLWHHVRGRMDGFGLGLVSSAAGRVTGWQVGAVDVGGAVDGAQMGVVTLARGPVRGFQVGAVQLAGPLQGAQLGVVGLARGDTDGLQVGVFDRVDGRLRGVQLGAVNHVEGDHLGLAVGVVNTVTGTQKGLQWGAVNVVLGRSAEGQIGWQLGVYNRAANGQKGAQLGVVNDSARLRGAQLGVVNVVGEGRGAMIGLVNVAERLDGEAVGLINVIRNGYHAVELWTDEVAPVQIGVKAGSRHLYGIWNLGIDPTTPEVTFAWGVGLGGHLQKGRLLFDVDLLGQFGDGTGPQAFGQVPTGVIARLRPQVGVHVGSGIGLFFGITGNGQFRWAEGAAVAPTWIPSFGTADREGVERIRWWAGYTAGIRYAF